MVCLLQHEQTALREHVLCCWGDYNHQAFSWSGKVVGYSRLCACILQIIICWQSALLCFSIRSCKKAKQLYTIGFTDENERSLTFGQIQYFTLSAGDPVAVVKIFATFENTQDHFQLISDSLNSCLIPVCPLNTTQLVPVTKIKEKCVFIGLDNCYIARI